MSCGSSAMSVVIGVSGIRGTVGVEGIRGCLAGVGKGGVKVVVGASRVATGGNCGIGLFRVIRRVRDGWGTEEEVELDADGGGAGSAWRERLVRGKRRIRDSRESEEGAKDCRRSCSILAPVHRWRWACRRVLAKIMVWRRVGA